MTDGMLKLELHVGHFEELIKKGYSLDMIFLLKMFLETNTTYGSSAKIDNILTTMVRKGLITDTEQITDEGKELIQFLSTPGNAPKIPRKKKLVTDDAFTKWWKAYPPTNTFEYKGKKFTGDRALKVKKEECRVKFEKIIASGEHTLEEMIAAIKLEVSQKAESSIKTNTNKMSFMQNSLTYLNQCTYEPFIELVKAGHKPVEEETKSIVSGGISI